MTRLLAGLSLLCAALPAQVAAPTAIPVLLVTGANNHDWKWTSPVLKEALEETGRFQVDITTTPAADLADPAKLRRYQALLLDYNGPRWGEAAEAAFLDAVQRGTGVVVVHAANNAFPGWVEYERMVGLCWREGTGHGAFHPFDIAVVDRHHPITQGMEDLRLHPDELYHRLVHMHGAEFRVLLSAFSDPKTGGTGRHEPMALVSRYGDGRVFHTPLGHVWTGAVPTRASVTDPQFRRLLARGTEWAATGSVTLDPFPLNMLREAERRDGFQLLFNGRDLSGWRAFRGDDAPTRGWVVREASLVHQAGGGGGDLVTIEQFADFDLRFEWRVLPNANSGVLFWVQEDQERSFMTGPEYQILDDLGQRPSPQHGAAALYDLVVPAADKPVRPAGTWNEGRIVVQEGRLRHWLNGMQVVDVNLRGGEWQRLVAGSKFRDWPFAKAAEGHIALQDHGDEVAFRNLRIKRL